MPFLSIVPITLGFATARTFKVPVENGVLGRPFVHGFLPHRLGSVAASQSDRSQDPACERWRLQKTGRRPDSTFVRGARYKCDRRIEYWRSSPAGLESNYGRKLNKPVHAARHRKARRLRPSLPPVNGSMCWLDDRLQLQNFESGTSAQKAKEGDVWSARRPFEADPAGRPGAT